LKLSSGESLPTPLPSFATLWAAWVHGRVAAESETRAERAVTIQFKRWVV